MQYIRALDLKIVLFLLIWCARRYDTNVTDR